MAWPVGIFATFAIAHGLLPARAARRWEELAAAILLAIATLPSWNAASGPSADAASIPTAKALASRLDVGGAHEVLFDPTGLRFAEPYSTVVLLELQRRGVEVRVTDAILARQVGSSRKVSAAAAARLPRLVEREGDAAVQTPPGADVVSRVRALDADGKAELDQLEAEVGSYIASDGIHLNRRGLAYQRSNGLPSLRDAGPVLHDPSALLGTAELNRIIKDDLASGISPEWRTKLARYAELREDWNVRTVAIYRFLLSGGTVSGPLGLVVPVFDEERRVGEFGGVLVQHAASLPAGSELVFVLDLHVEDAPVVHRFLADLVLREVALVHVAGDVDEPGALEELKELGGRLVHAAAAVDRLAAGIEERAAEDVRVGERGDLGDAGPAREAADVDPLGVDWVLGAHVLDGEEGERQAPVEDALLVPRVVGGDEDEAEAIERRPPDLRVGRAGPGRIQTRRP